MLALLSLQVLRTVEIWRANVDDVQRRDDQWALLVRGKGHDRLIFLRCRRRRGRPALPRAPRTPCCPTNVASRCSPPSAIELAASVSVGAG